MLKYKSPAFKASPSLSTVGSADFGPRYVSSKLSALAAACSAQYLAEYCEPLTVPPVYVAQSFAEPVVPLVCVPTAYSLAEYSVPSTCPVVSIAQSFAGPLPAESVTPVPPIAYALDE